MRCVCTMRESVRKASRVSAREVIWLTVPTTGGALGNWFGGQPAVSAPDAEIASWFRKSGDVPIADWFRRQSPSVEPELMSADSALIPTDNLPVPVSAVQWHVQCYQTIVLACLHDRLTLESRIPERHFRVVVQSACLSIQCAHYHPEDRGA